jgi:hypothetical protein
MFPPRERVAGPRSRGMISRKLENRQSMIERGVCADPSPTHLHLNNAVVYVTRTNDRGDLYFACIAQKLRTDLRGIPIHQRGCADHDRIDLPKTGPSGHILHHGCAQGLLSRATVDQAWLAHPS